MKFVIKKLGSSSEQVLSQVKGVHISTSDVRDVKFKVLEIVKTLFS